MRKIIIGVIAIAAILGALVIGGGLILVSSGPDTYIYAGGQTPARFVKTVRSLGLLSEGESIRYFYSDALFDIKDGFYLVTDRHLILYSDTWAEPETVIPFDTIESVDVVYNESFFVDTWVQVLTEDGLDVSFPLSSERGLDKRFVALLEAGLEDPDAERLEAVD
ncbi:MAG: hypothetical protein AAF604_07720 [Acidobacteriota bacterium]